jgi:ubiquinone/menaquinone biosynthesis C-methylase UbiE
MQGRIIMNNDEIVKNRYINTANLYDLDQRDNLVVDIPFYLEYATKQGGNILELGCGTGRVSIELAKAGYDVTGLDISEPMLEIYKNKIKELSKNIQRKITLIKGNMANFTIDNKFSLIITPFRAFQALTDDNDIKNSLKCIKSHLDKEGIFIINVFRPYKKMDESWIYPETIQWERDDERNRTHVIKKHRGDKIDTKNQIIYPSFIYEIINKDGILEKYYEHLTLKYYYYEQLMNLLKETGFTILEEYGWYDKSKIENNRELIIISR